MVTIAKKKRKKMQLVSISRNILECKIDEGKNVLTDG